MIRRWPALLVISGLLVGGGLVDRGHTERQTAKKVEGGVRLDQPVAAPLSVAAPAGALSSTWYCSGGTATRGGAADMAVTVANSGSRPLLTEISVVPDTGRSRTRQVVAPAHGRVRVLLRTVLTARYAAALVEVRGGGVSVEREVTGPQGSAVGPCAASSSDHWYLAAGSTQRGADEYLALFNPYPDDASVDMTFATEQGLRAPRRLQAFPVPGRSLRVIHLNSERVNRHSPLAAEVVARSGRLVVDRLGVFSGNGDPVGSGEGEIKQTPAPRGLTVATAVARPVGFWAFPAGGKVAGEREQIVVSNPSRRDASVDVDIVLEHPQRNGRLDPLPLSVPAHGVKVLDVTDQATVPDNVGHSITVRSTNAVPVVAERVLSGAKPWRRTGVTMSPGLPLEATGWLFAAGGVASDTNEQLVVQNLSGRSLSADVTVLDGSSSRAPALRHVTVPATGRATIVLDVLRRPDLSAVLRATAPVVVERGIYHKGRVGISIAAGVPLPNGARFPLPR